MTQINRILAFGTFALLNAVSYSAHALPSCVSATSDSDGDGYGWENNSSCLVVASSGASSGGSQLPGCQSANSDTDGDGFGWENGASCLVGGGIISNDDAQSSGTPSCVSSASDSDGDGYGWENSTTCLVTASTGQISDDAGSATSNGIADDAGSSTSNGVLQDDGSNTTNNGSTNNSSTNNGGSFTSGTGGGAVISSSSLTTVASETVSVSSAGGDLFSTRQVGDFQLMQNAWRAWRAADGYDWNQSIYTNNNGTPVGWSYDWGPGVPGASGRASDDYYVRSYPELIYGIKDEFRTSASKSEIGFPVRVDTMPVVQIDYSYSAPQYGAARPVDASVNSAYPNGTTINGERNVAVESFFYESDNGVCDDSLAVTRNNGSNHVYEVMVWLDSGAERLPAAARDFVTNVTLRGDDYKVYTKGSDPRYIAFVAQNPTTAGTIYWNDFIDWSRLNAHRVSELFGARSNSVQIQDSWCVANIIVGTEIFWGAGNFDLYDWTITQRQP